MSNKFEVAAGDPKWLKKNVNCQYNCPVDTNVPEYIDKISQGLYADAYVINRYSNVLPGVLGRICTHPCEDLCRRCLIDEPIAIRDLKRVAADFGFKDAPKLKKTAGTLPQKIAIVGGGPAGLAAARDLAEVGYNVMIYEGMERLGGMLWAGMPDYRLAREVIQAEIEANVLSLGVEYKLNTFVGKDIMLGDLMDQYDAVLMCAGTYKQKPMATWDNKPVPGMDHPRVVGGLDFMANYNRGNKPFVGNRVAVLGGGFTAVDCIRSAIRLGAKKGAMLYRRTVEEISVTEEEIKLMEQEGIELRTLVSASNVVKNSDGSLKGLELVKMKLGEPDSGGRRKAFPIEGSDFFYECDLVVVAFGQDVEPSWCKDMMGPNHNPKYPELKFAKGGEWFDRDKSCMTMVPGLFIAGDFFSGANDVVHAMGDAHLVAQKIDQYLKVNRVKTPKLKVFDSKRHVYKTGYDSIHRQEMDLLSVTHRRKNPFEEVELGLNKDQGAMESARCLLCQNNININPDVCILCGLCVEACPYDVLYMIPAQDLEGNAEGVIPKLSREQKTDYSGMLLDEKRCIRCGNCVDVCPTQAINFIKIVNTSTDYHSLITNTFK